MSFTFWPASVLRMREFQANPVPFTRSGGPSLGGIERVVRTDRGYWAITTGSVSLRTPAERRVWNALRTQLNGRAGLIVLPAWSYDTAPWPSGQPESPDVGPHGDGAGFGDGSGYLSSRIAVEMAADAALGATLVDLRAVSAAPNLAGIRFSYQHALYETGPALSVDGDVWRVPVFPAIRQAIAAGEALEVDRPTILCRLAGDRGMETVLNKRQVDHPSVSFVEAVDFWNDLAEG